MKKIILLGASGSIGIQSIEVIKNHPDQLELVGVSVGNNIAVLYDVLKQFDLKVVYSIDRNYELEKQFPNVKFYYGDDGLINLVNYPDYDLLINALVGFAGFKPTLQAINNHKDIALANKETLVAGGKIINEAIKENDVKIFPIDSEHCAIWQCINSNDKKDIRRLIITASGGSFRNLNRQQLNDVTVNDALNHPNWSMGSKITIDSATMMNKCFEVIEAHYLFDMPYDKIDVILHEQSIIHSMVEYNDGSIIAQLGVPDMKTMIKYALLYPNHLADNSTSYLDLDTLSSLNFRKMDYQRYPLLKLAKQVGSYEGNFGALLIGANDEAVNLFLKERIKFIDIETCIFNTLKDAHYIVDPSVDQIIESNILARNYIQEMWANSKI